MNKMNLPNKITCVRIALAVIILVILTVPWYQLKIEFPVYSLKGIENIELQYLICGGLFLIASVTDFLDGYIARSRNLVTDFGKVMDAIADKVLVNGLLVILAYKGMISLVVPVVIITRDIVVDSIKMASGSKGKVVADVAGEEKQKLTIETLLDMFTAKSKNDIFSDSAIFGD